MSSEHPPGWHKVDGEWVADSDAPPGWARKDGEWVPLKPAQPKKPVGQQSLMGFMGRQYPMNAGNPNTNNTQFNTSGSSGNTTAAALMNMAYAATAAGTGTEAATIGVVSVAGIVVYVIGPKAVMMKSGELAWYLTKQTGYAAAKGIASTASAAAGALGDAAERVGEQLPTYNQARDVVREHLGTAAELAADGARAVVSAAAEGAGSAAQMFADAIASGGKELSSRLHDLAVKAILDSKRHLTVEDVEEVDPGLMDELAGGQTTEEARANAHEKLGQFHKEFAEEYRRWENHEMTADEAMAFAERIQGTASRLNTTLAELRKAPGAATDAYGFRTLHLNPWDEMAGTYADTFTVEMGKTLQELYDSKPAVPEPDVIDPNPFGEPVPDEPPGGVDSGVTVTVDPPPQPQFTTSGVPHPEHDNPLGDSTHPHEPGVTTKSPGDVPTHPPPAPTAPKPSAAPGPRRGTRVKRPPFKRNTPPEGYTDTTPNPFDAPPPNPFDAPDIPPHLDPFANRNYQPTGTNPFDRDILEGIDWNHLDVDGAQPVDLAPGMLMRNGEWVDGQWVMRNPGETGLEFRPNVDPHVSATNSIGSAVRSALEHPYVKGGLAAVEGGARVASVVGIPLQLQSALHEAVATNQAYNEGRITKEDQVSQHWQNATGNVIGLEGAAAGATGGAAACAAGGPLAIFCSIGGGVGGFLFGDLLGRLTAKQIVTATWKGDAKKIGTKEEFEKYHFALEHALNDPNWVHSQRNDGLFNFAEWKRALHYATKGYDEKSGLNRWHQDLRPTHDLLASLAEIRQQDFANSGGIIPEDYTNLIQDALGHGL